MSKSRSTTPVPSRFHSISPPTTPSATASPTAARDPSFSVPQSSVHENWTYLHRSSPRLYPQNDADFARQTMARILHRPAPQSTSMAQSSASPDSQEGLLDIETDVKEDRQPAASAPPAPGKKKRTRTLTTPHQSAVLYALLAESRFPSTAVREAVGRSIGLSSRKVQIWFQNQRQKARRPQKQCDTSRTRSQTASAAACSPKNPPYSFPNPGSASYTSELMMGSSFDPLAHRGYLPDTSSQLSGPGMPGSDSQFSFRYGDRPSLPPINPLRSEDSASPIRPSSSSFHGSSSTRSWFTRSPALDSDRRPGTSRGHSDSYKLPPLVGPHSTSTSAPTLHPLTSELAFPPLHSHPISPEAHFAYHPSDVEPVVLPPPRILQTYPPRRRSPEPTSSPGPSVSFSGRLPPLHTLYSTSAIHYHSSTDYSPSSGGILMEERNSLPPDWSQPQLRIGRRYDPVRGTFVVTNPEETSSSSSSTFSPHSLRKMD